MRTSFSLFFDFPLVVFLGFLYVLIKFSNLSNFRIARVFVFYLRYFRFFDFLNCLIPRFIFKLSYLACLCTVIACLLSWKYYKGCKQVMQLIGTDMG